MDIGRETSDILIAFAIGLISFASALMVLVIFQRFRNGTRDKGANEGKLERQMMLIKVFYGDAQTKSEIMSFVEIFNIRVLDQSEDHFMLIEVTGWPEKIKAVLSSVRRFKIISWKKTNKITLDRIYLRTFTPCTISLCFKDSPEVLSVVTRIIFEKRCNIESLAFSSAVEEGFVRILIVVTGEHYNLVSEFRKLEIVYEVRELTGQYFADQESMFIKVCMRPATRKFEVLQIAGLFHSEAVTCVGDRIIILQFTGNPKELLALMEALELYGTCELTRTGPVVFNEHTLCASR